MLTDPTADQHCREQSEVRIQRHLAQVDGLLSRRLAGLAQSFARIGAEPITTQLDDQLGCQSIGPASRREQRSELSALADLPRLLTELVGSGGKRLRPILSYLGFWVCGGDPEASGTTSPVRVGAAFDLLHSFALVHDDVMDESDSRRGRPTTHVRLTLGHRDLAAAGDPRRFGENIAILLGDLAHAEADSLIAECGPDVRARWHAMVLELINGQFGDLAGAADGVRDPYQALLIARLKSGAYTIQRPLELGAVTAGAGPALLEPLSDFGQQIGWAFALRDDLLGVWGDPEITGKPAGDDLLAGKPTVIVALADQRLSGRDHRLLDRIGTPALGPRDVRELQTAIRDCGVEAEVEKMITRHLEQGLARLDDLGDERERAGLGGGDEPLLALARVADSIAWRDR